MSQNIILLIEQYDEIEPYDGKWNCPFKIGKLYMNKLAIDEDDGHEILFVGQLLKSSEAMLETEIIQKPKVDLKIIENIFQNERFHLRNGKRTHLILSSCFYVTAALTAEYGHEWRKGQLCEDITHLLGNFKLKSIIMTFVNMNRTGLLTKEQSDDCFIENGGLPIWTPNTRETLNPQLISLSQSEDLDDYLNSIEKNNFSNESKESIIVRKLTSKEMKSAADFNHTYIRSFNTYCQEYNPWSVADFFRDQHLYLQSKYRTRYASMMCFRNTFLLKDPKISWTQEHAKMKEVLLKASRKKAQKRQKLRRKK